MKAAWHTHGNRTKTTALNDTIKRRPTTMLHLLLERSRDAWGPEFCCPKEGNMAGPRQRQRPNCCRPVCRKSIKPRPDAAGNTSLDGPEGTTCVRPDASGLTLTCLYARTLVYLRAERMPPCPPKRR